MLGKCHHAASIIDLFDTGSFDPDATGLWEALLAHQNSAIVQALNLSWEAPQAKAAPMNVALPLEGFLN